MQPIQFNSVFKNIFSHRLYFYIFLFTLPLSIRKVLFFFPINGAFNEYTGIYIYLSDIFLFLTLFFWLYLKLYNNFTYLSSFTQLSHSLKRIFLSLFNDKLLLASIVFISFSFISIIWSDIKILALFRNLKITELFLLLIYLKTNVSRGTFLINSVCVLAISATMQASLGIYQFFLQRSIGFFWLKESIISPETLGVAKLIINNSQVIRSYGLFPHPNIFGGYLIFSILLTLFLLKENRFFSLTNILYCSTWNNVKAKFFRLSINKSLFHVEQCQRYTKILLITSLSIQILALLLTFSKSAIIGILIATIYIVPRGTMTRYFKKLFHVEQLLKTLILLIIMILVFTNFSINYEYLFINSLKERLVYLSYGASMLENTSLFGIGAGQLIPELSKQFILLNWELQPIHNILFIYSIEYGVIGVFILLYIIYSIYLMRKGPLLRDKLSYKQERLADYSSIVPRGTIITKSNIKYFKGIMIAFIFISQFDHYFWDIQQGQLLFILNAGILYAISKKVN